MSITKEDRIDKLSREIIALKAEIEELDEARKFKIAALGELVDEGTTVQGDFKIVRRENRRFDAALAEKALDPKTLKSISVSKPDSAKAKALLDDQQLSKCQKVHGTIVTVGLRDD